MKVRIVETVDYAHRLHNYEGKCKNIHGHTATVIIDVQGNVELETGMIIDFAKLKKIVKEVLDTLDHRLDLFQFDPIAPMPEDYVTRFKVIPTAENFSKYIRDQLMEKFNSIAGGLVVTQVEFWETPGNCAIWSII